MREPRPFARPCCVIEGCDSVELNVLSQPAALPDSGWVVLRLRTCRAHYDELKAALGFDGVVDLLRAVRER